MQVNRIICGAMPEATKGVPDGSVNCSISSPPYWALRDYSACDCTVAVLNPARTTAGPIKCTGGKRPDPNCPKCGGTGKNIEVEKNQLGLEPTFEEYIDKLCTIYDEVKRVLRDDGTCWVNLGDTYNNVPAGKNPGGFQGKAMRKNPDYDFAQTRKKRNIKYPIKSLCLIPQRFAIEMVNRGWILRNVIVWHKPNPMPSSAKDRFTVDFEYVYFFVKSKKYWFEPQYEPYSPDSDMAYRKTLRLGKFYRAGNQNPYKDNTPLAGDRKMTPLAEGRNKRTVWKLNRSEWRQYCNRIWEDMERSGALWTIPTQSFPEAHFATFPEKLVEPMIKAGCPEFVCTKCGKGREKIWDTDYRIDGARPKGQEAKAAGCEDNNFKSMDFAHGHVQHHFKGYTDCGCGEKWRPGIVLDCFLWKRHDLTGSCKAAA